MPSKKEPKSLPRRGFLKMAGLVPGSLGVAAISLSAQPAKAEVATFGGHKAAGYQETEHVRTYYQLARS